MKKKRKHGPIKSAYELALEKLGQTEAEKINAIYQNATPAQKKQIAENLLKLQHSAEGMGKLYMDGKEIGDVTGIQLHLPKGAQPYSFGKAPVFGGDVPIHFTNCKCVPGYDIQPLDDKGIKMVVVERFVQLLEAYGLPAEVFAPESEAAQTSVAYCLEALKRGRCVAIRRVALSAQDNHDGTADISHTFQAVALPKPNGK